MSFAFAWLASLTESVSFALFFHLPGFLQDLGADEVQIGVLFATAAIASIAVRPTLGRAMDKRGRRRIIIAGGVLNTIVTLLYLTVTTIGPWLYVVRIGHGVAMALLFTSLFTYAADRIPAERRTQGLALFGISGMLPFALGGVIGDLVLDQADFDALFYVAAGFAFTSLLLTLPLTDAPGILGDPAAQPRFSQTLLRRDLLPLWLITMVFATALAAYFTFLKTFVIETGVGSIGLFFGAYAGTAIVLRVALGWLPDALGQKRVLYPALIFFAAGLVVLAFATTDSALAVAGVLCGTGHAYAFPILFGLVVTRAPQPQRGSAMAIYTALFDVGILVGGPAFGLAISLSGYRTMFITAAATVLIGAVVFATVERSAVEPVVQPAS